MIRINNKKYILILKNWLYDFTYKHPILLDEEVNIILQTREEERYKWMNDKQIQLLIKKRIKSMYKKKFPELL